MDNLTNKILIVDDDKDILDTAKMFLKLQFDHVTTETNPYLIEEHLRKQEYSVVLLDMNFKKGVNDGSEGMHWLKKIKRFDPHIIVILITAYGEVDLAVQAMKEGATDFVLKPWKNQKLLGTIMAAIELNKSKKEVSKLKQAQKDLSKVYQPKAVSIIGQSPAMERIQLLIDKVASTDADVLILGENGTGKELIAQDLHRKSGRTTAPFISVDMGAITETLFESELFGHKKGAFTDARNDRTGRFELASGGSLFLDEIGNLSIAMQSKLLTVLQSRQITPVGANHANAVDIRLISATNMPLYQMVEENKFRQDLLYRLNTVEIHLPPLRERKEDIEQLSKHFLSVYAQKYQRDRLKISPSVMKQLQHYKWPGNIRELQHAIERAVILTEGHTIEHSEILINKFSKLSNNHEANSNKTLDEMEKHFMEQSLVNHKGNISKTAQSLGLTRTAMYRRMKKHGLQ